MKCFKCGKPACGLIAGHKVADVGYTVGWFAWKGVCKMHFKTFMRKLTTGDEAVMVYNEAVV